MQLTLNEGASASFGQNASFLAAPENAGQPPLSANLSRGAYLEAFGPTSGVARAATNATVSVATGVTCTTAMSGVCE